MQPFKPLHLAISFDGLYKFAYKGTLSISKTLRPKDIAKMLYLHSKREPLDEEVTYVYLFRFLKVYEYLLDTSDDKTYIEIIYGREAALATTQLNDLTVSLKKRYDELNKCKKNKDNKGDGTSDVKDVLMKPSKGVKQAVFDKDKKFQGVFVSCNDLYNAARNPESRILIMDIRKPADFKESHIKNVKCINIPEDLIRSGLSTNTLGQVLPKESLRRWQRRDSFDVIVLMDWSTSSNNYVGSKLEKLRTILLEWDINCNYAEDPVILDNGYSDWLEMFPTLCTDPKVRYTRANADLDELLDLELIEYPSESHSQKKDPLKRKPPRRSPIPIEKVEKKLEPVVVVDKSETVADEILKQEEDLKNLQNKIANEYNISILEKLNIEQKELSDSISKLRGQEEVIHKPVEEVSIDDTPEEDVQNKFGHDYISGLKKLNIEEKELSDSISKSRGQGDITHKPVEGVSIDGTPKPSPKPEKDIGDTKDQENRQRLLEEARKAKKPEYMDFKAPIKPSINRATKPKPSDSTRLIVRVDPLKHGLTGLVNIKNTCYMNSVIQCLRHLPPIVELFCHSDYVRKITCKHPAILKETGALIRLLWNGRNHSVIRPAEFYNKMILLYPSYKQGHHEDCMEFFIHLFTLLTEDCAFDVSSKPHWSESELAWYSQHCGKTSFFIEVFYHQIRSTHFCKQCSKRRLKYEMENVFYVNTPNYDFKLQDCMAAYFTTSDQFTCKSCMQVYIVQKSICHYPQALVIALKRHLQTNMLNNIPVFKKNEKRCFFPIEYQIGQTVYLLKGISLHSGSTESGHYTAACYNDFQNKWYLFNDENVDPIDIGSEHIGVNAYAFFYSKVETGA